VEKPALADFGLDTCIRWNSAT